jgi:hypothetical protein
MKNRLSTRAGAALIIATALSVISGCATIPPHITADISAFHAIDTRNSADMKFSVAPAQTNQTESLKFRFYKNTIEGQLAAQGFRISEDPATATHIISVDYGIDDGRIINTPYSIPQFGIIGYSGAHTQGTISTLGNTSYVNSTTTLRPSYGITGFSTGIASQQIYRRRIQVAVVDTRISAPGQSRVYEATLISDGTCGTFSAVAPTLFFLMFDGFPGVSGTNTRRTAQWNGSC